MMTFEEYSQFKNIVNGLARELISLAQEKSIVTINPADWYAGITGQEDINKDGQADRSNTHPLQDGTWVELEVHDHELAKAVEDKLHSEGFRGDGNRGNMSLNPTVVYLYKIDFKKKMQDFLKKGKNESVITQELV